MEDKVLHQPTKDNGEGSAPLVHVKGDHGGGNAPLCPEIRGLWVRMESHSWL